MNANCGLPRRTSSHSHKLFAAATLFTLAGLLPAHAADGQANDTFKLGTVVVTGEKPPARAPSVDSVLRHAQLEVRHRDNLAEALNMVPGVSISESGPRNELRLSIRGYGLRQVPVFIDGIPVYVPYSGIFDLARFGVGYVSKIVVSKGLASLLYGPNTLGGAINIVTRKPDEGIEGSFSVQNYFDAELGSQGYRVTGSLGGRRGHWYGYATAAYKERDGFLLPDSFEPAKFEDGGERENAGSEDTVISAKVGYLPGNGDEYALSVYWQHASKKTPTPAKPQGFNLFWRWPAWDKESIYFVARNEFGSRATLRWRLYYDSFYNVLDSYDDASFTTQTKPFAFHSVYDDYSYGAIVDFEWRHRVSAISRISVQFKDNVHRETDDYNAPQEEYEDRIYYVAYEFEWRPADQWTLIPSLAYGLQENVTAEFSRNGEIVPLEPGDSEAVNAQFIAVYELGANRSVTAGISRKTRFPTIKERYSFRFGSALPNPDLEAERAMHYEVSYQELHASWGLHVALFTSEIQDAIEQVPVAPELCRPSAPQAPSDQTCSQMQNIGFQRKRGVEISGYYDPLPAVTLHAQATFLDLDNISRPDVHPINTPERLFAVFAQWRPVPSWFLRASVRHESRRFSNADGSGEVDDFTVADVFLRWEPTRALGLEIGVRNLTDELYAYDFGYPQSGRSFFTEIDYEF